MRWLRALLRGAIARDERVRVRRAVLLVVHVERLVGRDGIALVGHRRVEPVGQHFRPPRMRIERNVEVGLRQAFQRRARRALHAGGKRRRGRLRLIRAHQRAAARIAEDHDALDALLAQPFHAGADVDQRMLQREQVLGAAIARVPAEEAVTAGRDVGREVMLAEIAVVVRRDQRDARALALRRPVDALARMAADFAARRRRRRQADEARVALGGKLVMLGTRRRDCGRGRLPDADLRARLARAEAERDAGCADERRAAVDAHGILPNDFSGCRLAPRRAAVNGVGVVRTKLRRPV